jgi:hypothetical protein
MDCPLTSIPAAIESLPHWARVAFAARCARRVIPLFERFWPHVPRQRVSDLLACIELAEQAGAAAQPLCGLDDAYVKATTAAGAAQMAIHGFANDEQAPTELNQAAIATYSAKAVEWAAKAAVRPSADSAHDTLEAYTWARDAAHAAEAVEILTGLKSDLLSLIRVAKKGRWTDQTAVPPSVFDLLATGEEDQKTGGISGIR